MTKPFESIKIAELDDDASGPSGRGALVNIMMRLSDYAPPEWSDYFNQAWANNIYMSKRRANVSGNRLAIECMPDELEKDHIPELNKVIAETNRAFAQYVQQQETLAERQNEHVKQQRDQLSNLKKNLKFD